MKTVQLIIITALATLSVIAQPREGRGKELSLSGSFQSYSSEGSSGSSSAFLVSPRLGFFVVEGLEIEPEVLFMFSTGADPVYVLNGLVSYNFLHEGQGVPFFLVGYGIANTIPFMSVPFGKSDFTVDVLNAGGGVKVFLKEDVAVRVEYRFQQFSGEGQTSYYGLFTSHQKIDTKIHTIQFGFSILL